MEYTPPTPREALGCAVCAAMADLAVLWSAYGAAHIDDPAGRILMLFLPVCIWGIGRFCHLAFIVVAFVGGISDQPLWLARSLAAFSLCAWGVSVWPFVLSAQGGGAAAFALHTAGSAVSSVAAGWLWHYHDKRADYNTEQQERGRHEAERRYEQDRHEREAIMARDRDRVEEYGERMRRENFEAERKREADALEARFAAAIHAGVDAVVNAPDAAAWLTEWRERPGTARLANHVLFEPLLLRLINEYRLDPHADLV